jgi:polysaccharide biosynthesis protein VpsM
MRFFASAVFALLMAVAALGVGVQDAHALNFGRATVNPYVGFDTTYDDNVFRTTADRIDDWYFLISPGIKLDVPQRDNLFELEYRADIYKYIDTGKANNVVDHYLHGAAAFNFPGGMSIKVEDLANKSHESRSTANIVELGSNLSRYYSNLLNAEIAYAFADRYKVAVGYQNYVIDYNLSDQKYRDQFDNAATLTLFYQLAPKTSALVEGSYKRVVHDNPNVSPGETPGLNRLFNSNEYWARAGLTWNITAKSTGTIKGGYEWKIFDNPESKSFRSPIFEVDIDHNFTSKTAIKLSGLRHAFETDEIGASYYTDTTGAIEIDYKPVTKILVTPRSSFSYDDYSQPVTIAGVNATRTDNIWSAGIDVTYNMNKWISVGVGYTHSKRASDFTVYDYTDNLAMIKLKGTI